MTDQVNALQLSSIVLKNFRCFDEIKIDLGSSIILVCGPNGKGKTSLLEALYYACYLRSFRTHVVRDLIALQKEAFFIQVKMRHYALGSEIENTINIGFSGSKRLVKINDKATVSYKELLSHYRTVSLTEDDLLLIKGGPEDRRNFLDHALVLENVSFMSIMKEFRLILEQRNSLLSGNTSIDKELYSVWTQKLWKSTKTIQDLRKLALKKLETDINDILSNCFNEELKISFSYAAKKHSDILFEDFWKSKESLLKEELYFKRSLFGAHLDDFIITLEGKKSRTFASRGQQKMVVLLVKAAQIKQLIAKNEPVVFLLDDFMTDFDHQKGNVLLSFIFTLKCQLVFTSPHENSPLEEALHLSGRNFKKIAI